MELKELLAVLRAGWWLPVICAVLGAVMGLAFSLASPRLYESRIEFFVSTADAGTTADAFTGSQLSQERVASYARLLTGEELARRVVDRLELGTSSDLLAQRVAARAVPDTVILEVTVSDGAAAQAVEIADAIGAEFVAFVDELEAPVAGGESPVRITVVDPPDMPDSPTYPKTVRNTAAGGVAGLVVGALFAIARARLDRSVRNPQQASRLSGAPVLGVVMRDDALKRRHVVRADARAGEDFRQLRNAMRYLNVDRPPRVIMVSSAVPMEGKTTLAVNLAHALAGASHSVCLVDADLRRPAVHERLGLVGEVGLTTILSGRVALEDAQQPAGEGLSVVAAGAMAPNPGELLASSQMSGLLDRLRGMHDYVIVDASPLLPVADASGLVAATDGVLLAVRYGKNREEQLQQAALTVRRADSQVLGVVLTMVPSSADVARAYGRDPRNAYESYPSGAAQPPDGGATSSDPKGPTSGASAG